MTSTNSRESVAIEGVLKRDATQVKRGLVVLLSPWWHGPAHFGDQPLRVRIPLREQASGELLTKGTPVSIDCLHLEPPRAGASWWAATGSAPQLRASSPAIGQRAGLAMSVPVPSLSPVVVLLDRILGRLTLEPKANVFGGTRRFNRRGCYRLLVERSARVDDRRADHVDVERARAVVRTLELEYARIRDEVAARVLVLYHDKWRGHRGRLSRDKVLARIGISSAKVRVDGRVDLSFSEGDLFYGHWIEVALGADLSVQTVEVAGLQNVS